MNSIVSAAWSGSGTYRVYSAPPCHPSRLSPAHTVPASPPRARAAPTSADALAGTTIAGAWSTAAASQIESARVLSSSSCHSTGRAPQERRPAIVSCCRGRRRGPAPLRSGLVTPRIGEANAMRRGRRGSRPSWCPRWCRASQFAFLGSRSSPVPGVPASSGRGKPCSRQRLSPAVNPAAASAHTIHLCGRIAASTRSR
jgi:hypothetical protein